VLGTWPKVAVRLGYSGNVTFATKSYHADWRRGDGRVVFFVSERLACTMVATGWVVCAPVPPASQLSIQPSSLSE
jgi:hypothetical protein